MKRTVIVILLWAASGIAVAQETFSYWPSGLALIKTKLDRAPGAGFVVQSREPSVYVVTSAHVVEGDPHPLVKFSSDSAFQGSSVVALEAQEGRGLALLQLGPGYEQSRLSCEIWFKGQRTMAEGRTTRWTGDSVVVAGFPVPKSEFATMTATLLKRDGRDLLFDRVIPEGYSGGPVLFGDAVVGLVWGHVGGTGMAISASAIRAFVEGQGIDWPGGERTQRTYVLSDALERFVGLWERSDGGSEQPRRIRVFRRQPTGIDVARCYSDTDACQSHTGENWQVSEDESSLSLDEDRFRYIGRFNLRLGRNSSLEYSFSWQSDTGRGSGTYIYKKIE